MAKQKNHPEIDGLMFSIDVLTSHNIERRTPDASRYVGPRAVYTALVGPELARPLAEIPAGFPKTLQSPSRGTIRSAIEVVTISYAWRVPKDVASDMECPLAESSDTIVCWLHQRPWLHLAAPSVHSADVILWV